ncbi:ClpXP adapter SpxH family protein [Oceanobacillus halophilus]|uniref:ClpXP adapter protein SpxH n=1 Tax=Oceanobacillus halophilus TaxID=930130 RepID=A0A495A017_9BACI|nr:ClpXP adapter SpxH family protein [Oceanobacillus halophilus]RKQ32632.1 DsbA family protein [Oceanobacillus halophilus]
MNWDQTGLRSENSTNTSENYDYLKFNPKPIEMYVFIDPFCPECWYFEPYFKKLSMEYGRFFTIRPIVSSSLNRETLCKPIKSMDYWKKITRQLDTELNEGSEKAISSPWRVSLAIKAAEIQGMKAGRAFLRKIQEYLFLRKDDISKEDILMNIAKEAKLDMEEFSEDLYSATAKKAIQCDLQLTHEMEIEDTPTIVFFNHSTDAQGIKISGLYPYEVYEFILQETLQTIPIPSEKPPLEELLKKYDVVGTKEISIIYDWPISKAEKEMKKLQFKQKVNRMSSKRGTFWKYLD